MEQQRLCQASHGCSVVEVDFRFVSPIVGDKVAECGGVCRGELAEVGRSGAVESRVNLGVQEAANPPSL